MTTRAIARGIAARALAVTLLAGCGGTSGPSDADIQNERIQVALKDVVEARQALDIAQEYIYPHSRHPHVRKGLSEVYRAQKALDDAHVNLDPPTQDNSIVPGSEDYPTG